MLMSDMAVRELENDRDTFFDACRRVLVRLFGRTSDHQLPPEIRRHQPHTLHAVSRPVTAVRKPSLVKPQQVERPGETPTVAHQWRRHPQLRTASAREPIGGAIPRSARLEAERGMILARGGKYADAIQAFTSAAAAAEIDLTLLPGFWDLPRQGMMAAVEAYEANRRIRDAAALEARIRHTLRPRALKSVPATGDIRHRKASGE